MGDAGCEKESLTLLNFQCCPDYFFTEIDILGLGMLIQLYGDEGQVKVLQVMGS